MFKRKILFFMSLLLSSFTASVYAVEPFIVYAPPKCGTHLIAKALNLMLNKKPNYQLCELGGTREAVAMTENTTKNNGFVVAHNWSKKMIRELAKRKYKVIFILRDPRDQVISMQGWMREGQWSWLRVARMADPDQQLDELISGRRYGWRCYNGCIGSRYNVIKSFKPDMYYITRFENLVGEKGNGSREDQILELLQLADFLDHPLTYEEAESVADRLFGGTGTFRVGQVGRWKSVFKSLHVDLYKALYSKTLIELGYENDYDW